MRKFFAIALLAVFGLPFVSPLLAMTAKSETNLPACCRRNGKHNCMMSAAERNQLENNAPAFSSPPEKCPYAPVAILGTHHPTTFSYRARQTIYADLATGAAGTGQTQSKLRIALDRTHGKRGPPALFIL